MVGKGPEEYKMVFVVRRELGLSPGKTAVQVAHAAVQLFVHNQDRRRRELDLWLKEGQKKVALVVETLDQMEELRRKAVALGLPALYVEDAGYTEIPPGTKTILGIGPGRISEIDRVTGHLPLL